MTTTTDRVGTWDRRAGFVVRIAAGKLTDAILGRALTNADTFTLSAQVCIANGAVVPTALSGAAPVDLTWSADAQQWAAELPYTPTTMDRLAEVRVVVTLTAESTAHHLVDATVRFVRADGR